MVLHAYVILNLYKSRVENNFYGFTVLLGTSLIIFNHNFYVLCILHVIYCLVISKHPSVEIGQSFSFSSSFHFQVGVKAVSMQPDQIHFHRRVLRSKTCHHNYPNIACQVPPRAQVRVKPAESSTRRKAKIKIRRESSEYFRRRSQRISSNAGM